MTLKKTLSVFLAAVMIFSVCSLGFTGAAAEIDLNGQYDSLAAAFKNDYVRDLTNYEITNTTLDNGTEGFDTEANGFAYEHRVTAKDNADGDILKAANNFFYIAESILSTQHGKGCYDADVLVKTVADNLKSRFEGGESTEKFYVDAYGRRYYPTDEELQRYNEAFSLISALGKKPELAALLQYDVHFIEADPGTFYNYLAILKYFVGNVLKINAGNWYHRFSFVVKTSINTCLENSSGISSMASESITVRTAVYELGYKREYNETLSKAFYSFKAPSLHKVWEDYGHEFSLNPESADLTQPVNSMPGLLRSGQASAFMIKEELDTETVPYLRSVYDAFTAYIVTPYETKWDSPYIDKDDAGIQAIIDSAPDILTHIGDLTAEYSNEALEAVFGDRLGNMMTLAYILKKGHDTPVRQVTASARYYATTDKLDGLVHSLDNLVSSEEASQEHSVANRVAAVLKMFLKPGTSLGGVSFDAIQFNTLDELIGGVVRELVFTDGIVNLLVQKIYPMIVNVINDLAESIKNSVGGLGSSLVTDLINDIIENNNLAIYPDDLGHLIQYKYPGKYSSAAQILINAGKDWEKVNFAAMSWGLEGSEISTRDTAFLDAACAGLSGFTKLLITFLCGDAEYKDDVRHSKDDRFNNYYDRLVTITVRLWLRSQGLYTKLFIPLYRVLGATNYVSSEDYHNYVETDDDNCLRYALAPIVSWVTDVLAKKPIETILDLLPNLTHFLSRQGHAEGLAEDMHNWEEGRSIIENKDHKVHQHFYKLQTYSLSDILNGVFLVVDLSGTSAFHKSIRSLLGDKLDMLKSLNSLLNQLVGFKYKLNTYDLETACWCDADDTEEIVLPDSEAYALNPDKYEVSSQFYYSDPSGRVLSLSATPECPIYHENRVYHTAPYYIPAIPEGKLIGLGTVKEEWNTIVVGNPGLVLLYLLRYVFSALGYKYDSTNNELPILINCFGLDLEKELFSGLKLKDIIYNVMLHPDDAICALLELFETNEHGEYHHEHRAYTYPLEPIKYHENTLLNPDINPSLTYGTKVRYTKYWTEGYANDLIASVEPLLTDIMTMLGKTEFADGLGAYLENLINGFLTDDILNKLLNEIYQIFGGIKGFGKKLDLGQLLYELFDVSFTPRSIGQALFKMLGYDTVASRKFNEVSEWKDIFCLGTDGVDPITHDPKYIYGDVSLDWGLDSAAEHGLTRLDAFLRTVSALVSPAAFLVRFLLMDEELDVLELVNIPSYAGYQYAFIGLLEALSCPGIYTYEEYHERAHDTVSGDANTIYCLLSPIGGLLEKVFDDPINTVLGLIPNLMFFISIGGLNDLLNNLVHVVYVLLDIVKPVINGYDLIGDLVSNIDILGMKLNLALPLDIDFNALTSDLIGVLVGNALTFKGVTFHLPYIDFHTLCCGKLKSVTSKEIRQIVRLDAAGGGDLFTAVFRIVCEVLFMEENKLALGQLISKESADGELDSYDAETLYMIIDGLADLLEDNEVPDMLLYAVYMLATKLVPVADTLAERLSANNMTIKDVVASASEPQALAATLKALLKDPNEQPVPGEIPSKNAISSLLERIIALFKKIALFFQRLFTGRA